MSVASRREREREERRTWILDAAKRLFLEKGFDDVTMEDVAEAAQLGKGTLYLYFRTKDALLVAVAVRKQRELLARYEQERERARDGVSLVRALLVTFAHHLSDPLQHLRLVMSRWISGTPFDANSRGGHQMQQNAQLMFQMMCDAIRRGQEDGTIQKDIDPPHAAALLWSAVNGSLLLRLQMQCIPPPEIIRDHLPTIEEAVDFHLRSVATGACALPLVVGGAE